MNKTSPVLLLILDGWGNDTANEYNAITLANTPQWDKWQQQGQTSSLNASGSFVGLPKGQMGNSEVGHMHIGAGRVIKQNLSQISDDIGAGVFHQNPTLLRQIEKTKQANKTIHLMGLVSDGGVHSHQSHLNALIDTLLQQDIKQAFVHAFLDGRDCPPQSAKSSIEALQNKLDTTPYHLSSIAGRFYAMDRDKRWDRVQQTYDLLTFPQAANENMAVNIIEQNYANQVFDEFIKPQALKHHQPIKTGDLVIFFNFRADRARQLSQALTESNFNEFERNARPDINLLTMTQYDDELKANCIYPPSPPKNTLGECVAKANLAQLRIAETEKYAHVTFFLNGGIETPLPKEQRTLIPSPKVKTYDLKPEMSCHELTEQLIETMHSIEYQLIVCNYANADMVGHTGNLKAATQAIEALDQCFSKLDNAIQQTGFQVLITADHGNAERMFDKEKQLPHTAHTSHPVPLVYLGNKAILKSKTTAGSLIDLAPSILYLLDIEQPIEMTGTSLLTSME